MKTHKVLYVHANNYDLGGSDYCLFKMVYEMNRTGYDTIVLLSKQTPIVDLYKKHKLNVIIKPIFRIQKTDNPLKLFYTLFGVLKSVLIVSAAIKKYEIDIVHSNDLLDFSANIAAKLRGVVSIQHIRMIVQGTLKRLLRKITLLFTDEVLAVSYGLKKIMYRPTDKKVKVLYDWIDLNLVEHNSAAPNIREVLNIAADVKIVGCVGRLEYWKGQHVFIQAAAEVIKGYRNCIFLIVGGVVKGKELYSYELEERINRNGLKEAVYLLGERKDISNLYRQFDFAVHCSVEPDPFPGVVLEALVNNCAIIGTKAGGVPEEIDENITGLLYEPDNYLQLADKILFLLKNETVLKEMKAKSKSSVLEKFEKEKIVLQLDSTYRNLLK